MGRRGKSVIEDLLTVVARAPWPVAVVLAVVSFMVLNQVARVEPVQAVSTADISQSPNIDFASTDDQARRMYFVRSARRISSS